MNLATIRVTGVKAQTLMSSLIPAGIVGATVSFDFADPQWEGLTKTAVFQGCVTRDRLITDNTVVIPAETVAQCGPKLMVGVYGVNADNQLVIPTMWATLGSIRDAADPSGDPGTDPKLPIWAQLQEEVEDLKESIPDETSVKKAVDDYLTENPLAPGPAGPQGEKGDPGADGPAGPEGKSAYKYAQEGGYTGTEEEFAAKLAEEYPQPDWNAAEGEPGHILNRTHWVDVSKEKLPVTHTGDTSEWFVLAPIGLVVGEKYIVNWNGTDYQVTGLDVNALSGGQYPGVGLGNPAALGGSDNGLPFGIADFGIDIANGGGVYGLIGAVNSEADLDFTLHKAAEVIHKLDPKFLPESSSSSGVGGYVLVVRPEEVSLDESSDTLVIDSQESYDNYAELVYNGGTLWLDITVVMGWFTRVLITGVTFAPDDNMIGMISNVEGNPIRVTATVGTWRPPV